MEQQPRPQGHRIRTLVGRMKRYCGMTIETTENIVKLGEFKKGMTFPAINEVVAYWEGLRAGRQVPMRSEVNPRGIQNALEYSFILERVAPGMARFRLAGQHLSDIMGMEVRGMPFTSFFTPAARKAAGDALEAVFQGPEIAELSLLCETGIGKPKLDAKIVLLPLRSDLGDITRVLGCFVSVGDIGRAPRRFGISEHKPTLLAPTTPMPAAVKEDETRNTPIGYGVTDRLVPGFDEAKAAFEAAPVRKSERPYLRLIDTSD